MSEMGRRADTGGGILGALVDAPKEFELGEVIGKGAYGAVYAARYTGRLAAVKALPIEEGEDGASMVEELNGEIKRLRGCDCPEVVRYYTSLRKGRTLWIAMELCDGGV